MTVASAALATARRRASGHERAANRRVPEMGTLITVFGAASDSDPPTPRSALFTVPASAGTKPVTSDVAVRTTCIAASGRSSAVPDEWCRPGVSNGAHGAGMPGRSASGLRARRSNFIAPTPSARAWWILV